MDIVIAKIEDGDYQGKPFKIVTDTNGKAWKIKQGKDNLLRDKWGQLVVGGAYTLDMGEFKNTEGKSFPFIKNFHKTGGVPEGIQTAQPADKMSRDDWAKKDRITRESIERQVALKGAVELAVAGKIEVKDLFDYSEKCFTWLNGTVVNPTATAVKPTEDIFPEPKETDMPVIDLDWVKERLTAKKVTNREFVNKLRLDYDVPVAKTVGTALKSLNAEQLEETSKWLRE